MIIERLKSGKEFWTPYGLTSVAVNDPKYMTHQPQWLFSRDPYYWRGPIWTPVQYMAYVGLRKYGEYKLARKLAENWIELMARNPLFYEYYADGAPGLKKLSHFSWTAAVTLIFLNEEEY